MAINFYLIYGGILIAILFLCIFLRNITIHKKYVLFIAVFLIFIFMAFRKDFTSDYGDEGYKGLFESIQRFGLNEDVHSEIGYQLLNLVLPSYRWVIIVTSLFFCSSIYFLFYRYIPSRYWAFAFLVLFISKSMLLGNTSAIRNSIAVSAFIFSFYFLEENKKISYVAILIAASLFHTSSLFFIPWIFINNKKLTRKSIIFLWILIILFTFLTIFLPDSINALSLWVFANVSFVSGYGFYLQDAVNYSFRGFSFALIFYMLYMNVNTLKIQKLVTKEVLLIKMSLLFYILMLLPGIGLISRMYFYLSFPQLAGNIYVMRRIKDKFLFRIYIIGMIIIPIMEFYNFAISQRFREAYLEYRSILF